MHILTTISSIDRSYGGPSNSVPALVHALKRKGIKVSLFTLDSDHFASKDSKKDITRTPTLQEAIRTLFPRQMRLNDFEKNIRRKSVSHKKTIIHNHGIWLQANHIASSVARANNIPIIISPRGMLEPWALNFKRVKKYIAWLLYQKYDLNTSNVVHATADQEASNLRKLGIKSPIAVIPNGVYIPENVKIKRKDDVRQVLFLSRIHPKKGLVNLAKACQILDRRDWRVVVAGPDENGHEKEIKDLIKKLNLNEQFRFVGPVYDEKKWDLFSSSDIFVLPSFSENFGIVIAEALAAGIPVITTKATPWHELVSHNCGWWIDIGVEPLVEALNNALSLPDFEREAMGLRGKHLIENAYSWSKIASDMLSVYKWIIGESSKPSCVTID